MKNFYEMLKLLEDEQVKTPEGYTLTPEELEETIKKAQESGFQMH